MKAASPALYAHRTLSRRVFLGSSIAAASFRRLGAAEEETTAYGVSALVDGTGMVSISPGEFLMGSDSGYPDEEPLHRVRISRSFQISKFEVTQLQWETVMTDPHAKPGVELLNKQKAPVSRNPSKFKGATSPVDNVSYDDIELFLVRMNVRDPKHVYRLPTEAEWEYCCKAGKPTFDRSSLPDIAWYKNNAEEHTQPAGTKKPNAWGLYDMIGNVAEWVQDWYGPDYYAGSPPVDPGGPATGSYRVFRGGCWFDEEKDCRPSLRKFDFPVSRFYNVGFRVVRVPKAA